jgi:hypothetical protein
VLSEQVDICIAEGDATLAVMDADDFLAHFFAGRVNKEDFVEAFFAN